MAQKYGTPAINIGRTIWQCNKKFKNREKCKTPHIDENRIKQEFIRAFNDLIKNKNEVINDCKTTILKLTNTKDIDEKINKLNAESDALIELTKALVNKNSKTAMDQSKYMKIGLLTNSYNCFIIINTKLHNRWFI